MDRVSPETRSRMMAAVRSKDTRPEMLVRRTAHAMGLRFRLHRKDLPGRPDLVFPKHRLALFVHGCFWHRHEGCRRCTMPATNVAFWAAKFARNIERDRIVLAGLAKAGWRTAVVWECGAKSPEEVREVLRRLMPGCDTSCGLIEGASRQAEQVAEYVET